MHRSTLFMAAGLTGLLAASGSVAKAQTPSPPTTKAEAKAEMRPGPLDLVVYFRASGSDIDTASNTSLDELAVWLREDRSRTVFIEEHPDEAKAASFDVKLGTDRSEATRRYLVAHGAMDSQIRIVGHGQTSAAKAGDLNTRTIFISTSGGATASGEGEVTGGAGIGASAGVGVGDSGVSAGAGAGVGAGDTTPTTAAPAAEPAEPLYTPPVVKEDNDRSNDHLITPFGMSLSVGGGVANFFDQDARDITGPAGTWEARLTLGTRSPLAVEAAYVGSAQNVQALGLDRSAYLLGTSFEGDARLNFTTMAVQPYIFGGIGYTQFNVENADFNTSSVDDVEHMGHIPVGAGLGWQYGGLLLDVRGTLRAAFNDGLKREGEVSSPIPDENPSDGRAELDTWNVTGRVGFEF